MKSFKPELTLGWAKRRRRRNLCRPDPYNNKQARLRLLWQLRDYLPGCTWTSTAIWYIDAAGVAHASLKPI